MTNNINQFLTFIVDIAEIFLTEIVVRPLFSKTDPRVMRHPRQGNVPFCKITRTPKKLKLQALIGQSDWDLLRFLAEQLVQAGAITLYWLAKSVRVRGRVWKLRNSEVSETLNFIRG
jgi:hypothetical protein